MDRVTNGQESNVKRINLFQFTLNLKTVRAITSPKLCSLKKQLITWPQCNGNSLKGWTNQIISLFPKWDKQLRIYCTEFDIEELEAAIAASKTNKAPGPDRVQAELLKYLDSANRISLFKSYNDILMNGKYFDSLNLANIASIFKKGDPSQLDNYRPIALLQTFFKLLAAILKQRLVAALDPWISKTQYGFRPRKFTPQALFLARRLMDLAERQGTNLTLVLLDWEKAFDQYKLIQVLKRLGVPQNIVNTIQNIYKEAKFRVVRGDIYLSFRTQDSGIRQGCPLSPYLFSIITIFTDIRHTLNTSKQLEPIPGIHFAEVLYADDTLLFGTHTQTVNKLLQAVQQESGKYKMKLNMGKCINLTIDRNQSSINFVLYCSPSEFTSFVSWSNVDRSRG